MKKNLFSSILVLAGILLFDSSVRAQTAPPSTRIPVADSSLGTQVSGANNNFTIDGGLNRGQNLFHSFQDFSVPTGGVATFTNPVGNQSIITRVTGGNFSDINGTINTQGANFFLINPNGMVFGANAQLNVGQTFVGSTANAIDLVDGSGRTVTFGTNRSDDAQLLTIDPNALFKPSSLTLGGGNGQISNFGTLRTTNQSQYIGLIGGNVNFDGGQIVAPGSKVELGGLSQAGGIGFSIDNGVIFPANVERANVSLVARETSPSNIQVRSAGGGSVGIFAKDIILKGPQTRISAGISPGVGSSTAVAGDIKLDATGNVTLNESNFFNQVNTGGVGKGGNIEINARNLSLTNGAQLSTDVIGKGDGGNIKIAVTGDISFDGIKDGFSSAAASRVNPGVVGKGGNIEINARNLSLTNGSVLQVATFGQGDAGNIEINTRNLSLTNGGVLTTSNNATDFVSIIGKNDNSTGLSVEVQSPTGTAGDIILTSHKITVDGGSIVATSDSGNGGNIKIGAKSASSQNGIFNPSDVKLLILRNSGLISTTAGGTAQTSGNGGNITINAPKGFIVTAPTENSDITANAFSGSGGKVTINTQQNFWISSLSRAELELRLGTTDPNLLNPFGLQTNDITAISQLNPNLNGQVTIAPPEIDPSRGLSPLPNNITDPSDRIDPNCSAKAIANNSFTSVGRGGIPATPKDPLNEENIATNWVRLNPQDTLPTPPIATTPTQLPQPIVEAQGWRRERNGDIVLVASSASGTLPLGSVRGNPTPKPPAQCVGN